MKEGITGKKLLKLQAYLSRNTQEMKNQAVLGNLKNMKEIKNAIKISDKSKLY